MSYDVWSLTSRNFMHEHDDEAAAVETVRAYLDAGDLDLAEIALVAYDDAGDPVRSLTGPDLSALLQQHATERGRRTA